MSRASASWSRPGDPGSLRCFSSAIAAARCDGEDPAQPQARSEGLADRSDHHDAVGCESLQRPDRPAIVAELRVVVVLDQDAVTFVGPPHQVLASLGGEYDAGGVSGAPG
jgi:hypothetical protein